MKKDLKIEKMRIFACLMVILTHVSGHIYPCFSIGSFNWHIFNIYDSLSRAAVPVFVMISGILLLDNTKKIDIKKIYIKYIPKMLFILIVWSTIYTFWRSIILKIVDFNFVSLFKDIISGPFHLWYISVIIFLYIGTPILREITKNNNSIIPKYCFWIFLISSIAITVKTSFFLPKYEYIKTIIDKVYFDNILFWYSYFIIGYYIYKTNYLDKYKKVSYILGILGLISCVGLTAFASISTNNNYFEFYNNFGFPVYSMAIAMIFLMKNTKPKEKNRKQIEIIAGTTLGIYLLHIIALHFITEIIKYDISSSPIIYTIPLITIIIFIVSFIIVLIYKRVLSMLKKIKKE